MILAMGITFMLSLLESFVETVDLIAIADDQNVINNIA